MKQTFKEFLMEAQKDMTGNVVEDDGVFFVDREDVDTGKEIITPGEEISFTHKGKKMYAIVSDRASGRDDDVYELDLK